MPRKRPTADLRPHVAKGQEQTSGPWLDGMISTFAISGEHASFNPNDLQTVENFS
jgi:hypothetical protein